ncbi:hypothetical protein [Longirhabdus pacifica]|uniref:hypothetical protein n=1 Tax=Longirhabdus pacifica TaxID=2305227 RepID=UPI001008DBE1|nr:hypothetical protein [Longirhabdus pacifica]
MKTLNHSAEQLIRSNGSTTAFLEEMLQTKLYVEVLSQQELTHRALTSDVVEALLPSKQNIFMMRESQLHTSDNKIVSSNRVWVSIGDKDTFNYDLLDKNIPLGKQLAMMPHRRELYQCGQKKYLFHQEEQYCPYKAYVVHFSNHNKLYIHEVFLPSLFV